MNTKVVKLSTSLDKVPPQSLNGKFAIVRQSENLTKMKFSHLHDDVISVSDEADRLLGEHPTQRFLVVKVIATFGF